MEPCYFWSFPIKESLLGTMEVLPMGEYRDIMDRRVADLERL
jgi:hypothetical protein